MALNHLSSLSGSLLLSLSSLSEKNKNCCITLYEIIVELEREKEREKERERLSSLESNEVREERKVNWNVIMKRLAPLKDQFVWDCDDVQYFTELWLYFIKNPLGSHPLPPIPIDPITSFESVNCVEKLLLVWHLLIQFSLAENSLLSSLFSQSVYIPELSRLFSVLFLMAPSKKKFHDILGCLILSLISGEIFLHIIRRGWVPIEDILEGIISVLEENRMVSSQVQASGIKLSRAPSTISDAPPSVAVLFVPLETDGWDQLKSFPSGHPTVSLSSTIALLLLRISQSCDLSQLSQIRSKLSAHRLFPHLCLQFTTLKLGDLSDYLDFVIDETHKLEKTDPDAHLSGYGICRLDDHWLFSHLSLEFSGELIWMLFVEARAFFHRLSQPLVLIQFEEIQQSFAVVIRVLCALLTSLSNIHKVPFPTSLGEGYSQDSQIHWIEKEVGLLLYDFHNLPKENFQTYPTAPFVRLLTCLVFVLITSSRKQNPSSNNGSPTFIDHHTILSSLSTMLSQNQSIDTNDRTVYYFYIRACLSLDRIGFLRDAFSKELSLDRFIDFLPQNAFLYLSRVISSYQQKTGSLNEYEQPFIEQRKEKLLAEFLSLSLPLEISGNSQYPGDYLTTFCLLLKYRLMYILKSTVERFEDTLQHFKRIMTLILDLASWPPHCALLDVIDNWLEIAVNGSENSDFGGHHQPQLGANQKYRPECDGNILQMTFYPHEILENTKMQDWTSLPSQHSVSLRDYVYCLQKKPHAFHSSQLTESPPAARSDSSTVSFTPPLLLDSELLNSSLFTPSIGFSNELFRMTIYCYLSLKYQSRCYSSLRTQFSCVFQTDPRELPLKGAVIILLQTALWESSKIKQKEKKSLQFKSYLSSECCFQLFSSFTRLVRLHSPEVLISDRVLSITQSPLVATLSCLGQPSKSTSISQSDDHIAWKLVQSLISTPFCVPVYLTFLSQFPPQRVTKIVLLLLRHFLVPIFLPSLLSTSLFSSIADDVQKYRNVSQDLWILWSVIHSTHLYFQNYELETLNLIMELTNCRNPHFISSYTILLKEPFLLYRFPLVCYSHPLILQIVFTISRSISIASKAYCQEIYRINKLHSKQLLSHPLVPNNPSNNQTNPILQFRSPHIAPIQTLIRDGSSRIENSQAVEENEFLNLQDLITVRLILEIWNHICEIQGKLEVNDCLIIEGERTGISEELLIIYRCHLQCFFLENTCLLDSVLFYGVTTFPSFYLVSTCHGSFPLLLLEKISSNISSHTEPYMILASKNMELILQHSCFLARCINLLLNNQFLHQFPPNVLSPSINLNSSLSDPPLVSSTSYRNELSLSLYRFILQFSIFLKKSLKFHCWKQQHTAQPTLGKHLLETLSSMSRTQPGIILKTITACVSKDLFVTNIVTLASSPALFSLTSVLGNIQGNLLELKEKIKKEIHLLLPQEGKENTKVDTDSELRVKREREDNFEELKAKKNRREEESS